MSVKKWHSSSRQGNGEKHNCKAIKSNPQNKGFSAYCANSLEVEVYFFWISLTVKGEDAARQLFEIKVMIKPAHHNIPQGQ